MKARTKALAIPPKVKRAVALRDAVEGYPCCILCGQPAPTDNQTAYSCCHFIPRSQGGLGIEENILTLCPKCHAEFDQGRNREGLKAILRSYLKERYSDWSEDKLIYGGNV